MSSSRRTASVRVGFILATLVAGCGSPPAELAALHENLAVPACSEDAVSWPDGASRDQQVCEGPWEYWKHQTPCYNIGDCGDPISYQDNWVDVPNTCASPYFGVKQWGTYSTSDVLKGVYQKVCGNNNAAAAAVGVGARGTTCTYVCSDLPDCDAHAQSAATAEYNWISRYVGSPPPIGVVSTSTSTGPQTCTISCAYSLYNYPLVFNSRTDASVCGTHKENHKIPVYTQCRDPKYGTAPSSQCDPTAAALFTSTQTARSAVESTPDYCDPADARCHAPVCLTCESVAASDVNGKYQCLTSSYSTTYPGLPTADAASLKLSVTKHLLQFLTLHASQLSSDQRKGIYDIALAQPTVSPGCGWAPPNADAVCAAQPALNGTLALCDRISTDDAGNPLLVGDAGVDGALWNRCVSAIDAIATLSGDCRGAYLSEYNRIFAALLKRAMTVYPAANGETKRIQFSLQLLQRWYARERDAIYPPGAPRDALWDDLSAELGVFWRQTHRNGVAALDGGGQTTDQLLSALTNAVRADLDADATVLNAALTAPASDGKLVVDSAPLLYVVANALVPMSERLAEVGLFRDFGCRYNQNFLGRGHACEVDRPKTQMVDLLSMLAALPDQAALKSAFDGSAFANPQDPAHASAWTAPLQALASVSGHQAFEQAVLAVVPADVAATVRPGGGYGPELLTRLGPNKLPTPLLTLGKLVSDSSSRSASYQTTGLFQAAGGRILQTGVLHARQGDVEQTVKDLYDALDRDTTTYKTDLQTLIANLVGDLNGNMSSDDIKTKIALKANDFFDISSDLEGVRVDEAADAQHFGAFASEFKAVVNSAAVDGNKQVDLSDQDLSIGASEARFTVNGGNGIPDVAVQVGGAMWTQSVNRGDMLHIHIADSWSPTCALQLGDTLPSPANQLDTKSVAGSPTGPEGFLIANSGSSFKLSQNRFDAAHENSQSIDMSLRICAGVKGGFDEFGNAVWVSIEGCLGLDTNNRDSMSVSTSRSDGGEARQSLTLQSGLRVPGTPFPSLPLGSLLLVETKPTSNGGETFMRAHALQNGDNGIVFDIPDGEKRNVYFIVNDRAGCTDASGLALSVHVTHMRPVLAQATALATSMSDTLADVRNQAETILQQGAFMPEKRTALRSSAFARLQGPNGCNCDLSKFPPVLTSFFTSWLDSQLAHIERLVAAQDLERKREAVALELGALHNDDKTVADQARLLHVLPEWSMKDLHSQSTLLRESTRALIDALLTDLYPVIHLRYPSTYDYMDSTVQGELDSLVDLDWTASLYDLALLAKNAATGVRTAHQTAVARASNIGVSEVMLRFPNPYYVGPKLPPGVPPPADPPGPAADAVRARAVWDGILSSSGYATFTLNPEDLYRRDGGSGVLVCRDGVPSIRSMALVVGLPASAGVSADPINSPPLIQHTIVNPQMRFATGSALEGYTMTNATWLPDKLRMLASVPEAALSTFDKLEVGNGVGAGLSPFMSFNVNFNPLKALVPKPLDVNAKDVTVVMQLETATLDSDIQWATTCQ